MTGDDDETAAAHEARARLTDELIEARAASLRALREPGTADA